ncbi:DNA-binding domain-containing protein [Rhizobium sp. L1K21]|uniref:HvfC/BufC N-terminal domain-containing protein n=1 Tax=Rhizobium sp. L1K21 TaxID=2954933 RepID=UPI0020923338|nr:DNA-binding domain-containing protein [Rhizobium sp. L1K21]MCO6185022.1 DNA-binding domain-containing protein [Rhizobium sp. L1K21]
MAELQRDFAHALLDASSAIPRGLIAPNGKAAARRFSVYRNNVTHSLVNALADIFPSVQSLVGEDYFRAMARVFACENPPKSPLLFEYGRGFADFIASFEPANDLLFLPDVARLDRLWLDAYHAADAAPLAPEALGMIDPEELADIRFVTHPAASLLGSNFGVVTLVCRSRQNIALTGFDPMSPEFALVTRPRCDPQIHNLSHAAFVFTQSLFARASLGHAAVSAFESDADFDLSQALAILMSAGAFCAIAPEGGTKS